ncbi:MAG: DUF4397 domain-containing protein [Acidobacteriota bacterium]
MRKALVTFIAVFALAFTPAVAQTDATVTVLHLIPGGPLGLPANLEVDVYANDAFLFTFEFTDIIGPLALPAGDYEFEVFVSGADPDTDAPVLTLTESIAAGDNVDIAAHLTDETGIALSRFDNNATDQLTNPVSPRIASQSVRVTVRHLADFGRVGLNQLGPGITPTLINGDTLQFDVNPLTARLWLSVAGWERPISFEPTLNAELMANTAYYIYAIGQPADGSFQLLIRTVPFN